MNIGYDIKTGLSINGEWITLDTIRPVVNGKLIQADHKRLNVGSNAWAIQYPLTDNSESMLTIEVVPEDQNRCNLKVHFKNPSGSLNSFGIHIQGVHNLRSYLRNGFHSWDGSYYEEPENIPDRERTGGSRDPGYGMTQLIPRFGLGSMTIGFDRHDRYQQKFQFDCTQTPPSLQIVTMWDCKDIENGICSSEWLLISEHAGIEDALMDWARLVASISDPQPRISGLPITGWCSWYNLYGYISQENILSHLESAREVKDQSDIPMQYFQIDDGFTPEMGDWLLIKPQFPSGMKQVLDRIREAGFKPGLWIAPFLVGNRSELFKEHPDWVLHDVETGSPITAWRLYGEQRWFKRSEVYYVLDATHPQAFDYLRIVFRIWRQEWGCEYFKTDFMLYGCLYGPDQVKYFEPGLTRIEIFRKVGRMIREEIKDAVWLGCGCPLWASIGLVDAIRVSGDIGVSWSGGLSAHSLLRDLPNRNFTNHILWQIDPDCILLRDKFHYLSNDEVEALAIFAGMSGGVTMASDFFGDLSSERLELWKLILPDGRFITRYPLMGKSPVVYNEVENKSNIVSGHNLDPIIVQVKTSNGDEHYTSIFVLNTSDETVQRTFPFESIGLVGPLYVYNWRDGLLEGEPVWHLQATIKGHQGSLFFVSRLPLRNIPERI